MSLLLLTSYLLLPTCSAAADYPSWWTNRNVVITTGAATNDYAALTQGQLKWMASQARGAMEEKMPGGAGAAVSNLVAGFSTGNNYQAVNLGQLKATAQPFWDRLIEMGLATNYPWTGSAAEEADYSLVNIGQMKFLFSFEPGPDLTVDSDGDGIPDWWELRIVNANATDRFERVEHVLPEGDFDGDGVSNRDEALLGTNPADAGSAPCIARFATAGTVVMEPVGSNAQLNVAVCLTRNSTGTVSVLVRVAGGTAARGVDYDFADQPLVFAPGTTNLAASLTLKPDTALEPEETVILALALQGGPAAARRGESHIVTIRDGGPDGDGDGLPDWWESANGLNPNDPADASADPDGDGWTNLQEYRRGGNPARGHVEDTGDVNELRVERPGSK